MRASRSRLTRFQADILEAFFRREDHFFLTGGGALAGYHLGHRGTHDLGLFTVSPVMEDGVHALRAAAAETGATWQDVRTAPAFRRVLLSRGSESASSISSSSTPSSSGRRSRCTVSSGWIRPRRSSRTSCAPSWGARRSATSSTQLAWVLSQITIGDDATLPGGVRPDDLRDYLRGLIDRLARLAHP